MLRREYRKIAANARKAGSAFLNLAITSSRPVLEK